MLVHGGHIDDPPAAALFDHPLGGGLRAQERSAEDQVQRALPGLEVELQERRHQPGAGVVDQRVDPAERVHQLLDRPRVSGKALVEVHPARLGGHAV
jgi:hypothetical protein